VLHHTSTLTRPRTGLPAVAGRDTRGLTHLDAIAAIDGIDGIFHRPGRSVGVDGSCRQFGAPGSAAASRTPSPASTAPGKSGGHPVVPMSAGPQVPRHWLRCSSPFGLDTHLLMAHDHRAAAASRAVGNAQPERHLLPLQDRGREGFHLRRRGHWRLARREFAHAGCEIDMVARGARSSATANGLALVRRRCSRVGARSMRGDDPRRSSFQQLVCLLPLRLRRSRHCTQISPLLGPGTIVLGH